MPMWIEIHDYALKKKESKKLLKYMWLYIIQNSLWHSLSQGDIHGYEEIYYFWCT